MLTARVAGRDLGVKVWKFPCGETGVKIESCAERVLVGEVVKVILRWEGNDDLVALAQLVDIVKNAGARAWTLLIPYFPYSRQDRRCSPGEAHALKVFCVMLNSLGFDLVTTYDAHSSVLEALVDKLRVTPQEECAYNLPVHDVLVAPDAGAEKKVFKHYQVADAAIGTKVLCASKVRDPEGKITGMRLPAQPFDIADKSVCVVDDLCDGGATFLAVADAIRATARPSELNLYVTHGMFTKGYDALLSKYDIIFVQNLGMTAPEVPECYTSRIRII